MIVDSDKQAGSYIKNDKLAIDFIINSLLSVINYHTILRISTETTKGLRLQFLVCASDELVFILLDSTLP